jgi:hypothetical protein
MLQDTGTTEDTAVHQVAARAAKYAAPWDKILHYMYLIMPLPFSLLIGAWGGVTDTYDSGRLLPVSLHV